MVFYNVVRPVKMDPVELFLEKKAIMSKTAAINQAVLLTDHIQFFLVITFQVNT